ncbi:hypothetical protein, partial [Salmonella enterica]|uniref:hypothetical protein n=1 Tax=Salmonella enterica TaxID=28901 RepID=UPI003299EC21
FLLPRPNEDISIPFDCLRCIDNDIHKDLIQLAWETPDQWDVSILLMDSDPSFQKVIGKYQNAFDALINIGFLKLCLIEPGIAFQALDDF